MGLRCKLTKVYTSFLLSKLTQERKIVRFSMRRIACKSMRKKAVQPSSFLIVSFLVGLILAVSVSASASQPVHVVFIHHSTGENWLNDDNGGLGIALRDSNYYVSDTNYGWGPNSIGDYTDIGHWWLWFRGPNSNAILNALYSENEQNCYYSRFSNVLAGENEVIMLKSCFPNSALLGNPNDPIPPIENNPLKGQGSDSEYHTLANAKGIYLDLLEYFRIRLDKLFVIITAPPLSDPIYADNTRAFNNWLTHDLLSNYPFNNVFIYDFYNVLTTNGGSPDVNDLNQETGNHHRLWCGLVQHKTDGDDDIDPNVLEYPSGDDHPSRAGSLKATAEFLPLLNLVYKNKTAVPEFPLTRNLIQLAIFAMLFGLLVGRRMKNNQNRLRVDSVLAEKVSLSHIHKA